MTALILTAALATAPTLPVVDGIDQDATYRGVLVEQIVAHQEYTDHIRDVWRHRRQVAAAEAAAAAAAAPAPVTPTYTSSSNGWADELAAVGFPASVIPTMLYIIDRESGGDPNAINASSGACGLTQIYPAQPGCLDPMTNLRMAYAKYQASGLSPWSM